MRARSAAVSALTRSEALHSCMSSSPFIRWETSVLPYLFPLSMIGSVPRDAPSNDAKNVRSSCGGRGAGRGSACQARRARAACIRRVRRRESGVRHEVRCGSENRCRHLCAQPVSREVEASGPLHGQAVAGEGLCGRQLEEPLHHRAQQRDVGDGAFALDCSRHYDALVLRWRGDDALVLEGERGRDARRGLLRSRSWSSGKRGVSPFARALLKRINRGGPRAT